MSGSDGPFGVGVGVGVVTGARVRVLSARTGDGIAMSFAPLTHRSMVLVELETADGLVGYGESWVNYPSWAAQERVATLLEGVLPRVVGTTVDDVVATQAELVRVLDPIGRQWGAPGPVRQAISAVDVALWDLAGKAAGRSVADLAGGRTRERTPVYASSLGPDGVREQAADCVRAGHTAAKVKVGFGRDRDAAALADARDALGAEVTLYADANQAWTLDDAVAMAPVLRETGVAWIEEPLFGDRVAELDELHRRTGLAVATGENVYGLAGFRDLADSTGVAILQPDVTKAGGLTEALAVCRLAEQRGKVVMPHLYGGALGYAATLQLAACAAPVARVEYDVRENPLRDPLLRGGPTPSSGLVSIPGTAGLGVELDHDAVDAYTRSVHVTGPAHGPST